MMEVRHESRGEAKADIGQAVRSNGRRRADLPTVRYLQTVAPQMVAAVSSRGHQRAGEPESPAEAHPVPQDHAGGLEVEPRLETKADDWFQTDSTRATKASHVSPLAGNHSQGLEAQPGCPAKTATTAKTCQAI